VDIDASGGAGGVRIDASAGRGGFSGTAGHDASRGDANAMDAAVDRDDADRITETDGTGGGDVEGGTCGPTFCFDVFECWILFPQCGYTVCELLTCKK
jgi:hypothetical protein